jgi:predicted NBD/HSP70 family sugar kinase
MSDLSIGIDVGGTNIRASLVKDNRLFGDLIELETPRTWESFKDEIEKIIWNIKTGVSTDMPTGFALPGLIDRKNGTISLSPNLEFLNEKKFEKIFYWSYIGNDADLALLGEIGQIRKPRENVALFTLGTGIGFAFFVDGKGSWKISGSGEAGHMKLVPNGKICGCGKKGCLDSEASNKAIHTKILEGILHNRFNDVYNMVDGDISKITIETFVKSCLLEHPDSMELLDEVCNYIALALSTVVNLINPSKIVVSGPITKIGSKFLQCLNDKLNKYSIFVGMENLKLELSNDKEYLNTIGAAMIVMEKTFICEPEFEEL